MFDRAARARVGIGAPAPDRVAIDPRISVDLGHLRRFEGRARAISFVSKQPARSILNGRHASRMRGRGLNFEELRGYLPGDDVRSIDWKVTARTGQAYVRVYTEERDRPALIMVDQRMPMFFGSVLNMKSVTAAETAALAAFRILGDGDRVGGIVFGDEIVAEIKPQRSHRALNGFLRAIVDANGLLHADAPTIEPMALNRPLEALARLAKCDHLVVLISDFSGFDDRTRILIGGLAQHNDVVLVPVNDPASHGLPAGSRLIGSDGLMQIEIDESDARLQRSIEAIAGERLAAIMAWQREFGIAVMPLSSGEATLPQLRRLMGLPVQFAVMDR